MVFALAIGWILTLCVIIWRLPPDGAESPDALASAYQRAVADRDRGAMRRLAPAADEPALDLLLDPPPCSSRAPRVVARDPFIDLQDGGTTCARLPIARHEGRWLVDPWAEPFD